MDLEKKAFYNLIRFTHVADRGFPCEEWQREDLRALPLEELFRRLAKAGIALDRERFLEFSRECETPEDLFELLAEEGTDAVYLLLFELWRRFLPERPSLSIFCDEVDHRIALYRQGILEDDEPLQDALANLKDVLEEQVDAGAAVFAEISRYCAHGLMEFIIDYITALIEAKNEKYASELIGDFAPFAAEPIWFDMLRTRLLALSDPIEANEASLALLERADELTAPLLLDLLAEQVGYGEKAVFLRIARLILERLEEPGEFAELLALSAEYFARRDRDDLASPTKALQSACSGVKALPRREIGEFGKLLDSIEKKQ